MLPKIETVSEGLNSVERLLLLSILRNMKTVSEGLNSVESIPLSELEDWVKEFQKD